MDVLEQYEPPNGEMYDGNYPIKYPNFNSDGDDEEVRSRNSIIIVLLIVFSMYYSVI